MSDGAQNKGLGLRPFLPAILLVVGWVFGRFIESSAWNAGYDFVDRVLFRAFGGFPAAQEIAGLVLRYLEHGLVASYFMLVGWGTFLVPLAFLVRMVARSRLRAGGTDPLERVRAWTRAHPRGASALSAVPAALWSLGLYVVLHHNFAIRHDGLEHAFTACIGPAVAGGLGALMAARAGLRAFLEPTIDASEETRIAIGPDEIVFDAVAVTRETRAAVGALAGLSLAMVVWIAALPILTLFRDPRLFAAVAAYVAVAMGSAALFRIASRVAVGVDGVLVKGTSRTRFFAYRDLDAVRVNGGDLELVRRDRAVLRLQLHGADAVRRGAVCARIRESIDRVKEGKHAVAAQLVASSSKEQLARVASGGADYRAASLSREALWALIEGPAVDAASRKAAAEALSRNSDLSERARLRVAAEHCADPHVRIALEQMADADHEEAQVDRPKAASSPIV